MGREKIITNEATRDIHGVMHKYYTISYNNKLYYLHFADVRKDQTIDATDIQIKEIGGGMYATVTQEWTDGVGAKQSQKVTGEGYVLTLPSENFAAYHTYLSEQFMVHYTDNAGYNPGNLQQITLNKDGKFEGDKLYNILLSTGLNNQKSPADSGFWATADKKYILSLEQTNVNGINGFVTLDNTSPEESESNSWNDNVGNINESEVEESFEPTYIAGSFAQKMIDFANMTNAIANRYNNNSPVYTLYLNFKCKGLQLVDTTSTEFAKNNFVKFDIEQKGAGVPNNFKLTILYKIFEDKPLDIEAIDDILLATTKIVDESGNLVTTDTMNNVCEFVYGYGNDPNLRSQTYKGIILDYDQTINHGYLEYNITGTAWVYVANETKFSRKPEHIVGIDKEHPDPFQFLQNFIDTEFSEKSSVTGKRLFGLMFDESAVGGEASNAAPPDYLGAFDDLTNVNNKTLYQIIGDVLAGCIHQTEAEFFKANKNISPTQKQIYSFFVDNTGNSECDNIIWVYKVPSESTYTSNEQEQLKHADAQITFNWYGHSGTGVNHFVKSWKPSFEGALLLSLACSLQKTGNTYVTLTEEGEVKTVKGINSPRLGVKSTDTWATLNTAQEYSRWSAVTQYTYSATLVIQGVPVEVPIGGLIYVNPLWFNKSHHSGGIYFITEKIDNMSSSGYETTLKLVKRCISYDPEPTYIGISGKRFSETYEFNGVKYRVVGEFDFTQNGDEFTIDNISNLTIYDIDGERQYNITDINTELTSGVTVGELIESITNDFKAKDNTYITDNVKKYIEYIKATDQEKTTMSKDDFDLDGSNDDQDLDHNNDGIFNAYDKSLGDKEFRTLFKQHVIIDDEDVATAYFYINKDRNGQINSVTIKSIDGMDINMYDSQYYKYKSGDIYANIMDYITRESTYLPTGKELSNNRIYNINTKEYEK